MKKTLLALVLVLSLMVGLVACGAQAPAKSPDQSSDQTSVDKATGESTAAEQGKADATTAAEQKDGKKIKVLVTIYPLYDFTKKITGDLADVDLIVPAGIDAHDWEPNAEDLVKVNDANIIIYNGAGMEGWMNKVLASLNNPDLPTVNCSAKLDILPGGEHHHHHHGDKDEDHGHDHDKDADHDHDHDKDADHDHDHEHADEHEHHHDHGGMDPHVWLSPVNAKHEAEAILEGLVKVDPKNADAYKANFAKLAAKFDELDKAYRDGLKNVHQKTFVTNHQAFAYLAKEYGLKQLGITGVYADQEPSPADMAEVIDFVKANHVKVIFVEELLSPKVSEAIAEATGASTEVLSPIEGLTAEQQKNGDDYFSIMMKNLKALEKALN